jgi:hypothetical protein
MKKMAIVVLLLCSALAWAGSEPNPADYTISVHVSSSRLRPGGLLRLRVLIDGKKCELQAIEGEDSLLALGDYKAKIVEVKVKDAHSYDVYGTYEFLFPDKKTRRYALTGIME